MKPYQLIDLIRTSLGAADIKIPVKDIGKEMIDMLELHWQERLSADLVLFLVVFIKYCHAACVAIITFPTSFAHIRTLSAPAGMSARAVPTVSLITISRALEPYTDV